ncbi:MAG TPA: peptidase S8/S53 subtilisin kexin sedolisin, partial [Cyanobacteria bacterium UBA11166]|nr:peptidase S8/S53 subtilisin kexin sedolisin [Cyanobacteria bacterium UBA11166]
FDPQGKYMWVQGTSFSAPVVSGVLALMAEANGAHRLSSNQLVDILKETASYDYLTLDNSENSDYPYQFGSGLVNGEAAVKRIKEIYRS